MNLQPIFGRNSNLFNYFTVKDLMIPTPMKLKYIPVLKYSSQVILKKGKTLNQNYSDFEIIIVQNRLFSF
jgi:hypothetical protein